MSSFSSNQKCNSPKASAQALLARQFLEEHGWKVVENLKSRRAASSTPPSNPENDEVVTPTTCNLPGLKPSLTTSSSFSGSKFFDSSSAPPSAVDNVETVDDSGITTTSNGISYQRTKRGISNTESNFSIVSDIQDLVCDVFTTNSSDPPADNSEMRESFKHTFVLPDFGIFPLEFREFLHKELIETSTLVSLEQSGRLNWWHDLRVCQRLLPLATTGDGNCLLHAASLGIWGFHDRRLTLRKALHDMLTTRQFKEDFQKRWKYHQEQVNKQSGLIYNEKEWTEEWDNLIKLASPQPRTNCDQQQQEPKQQQQTMGNSSSAKSSDIFYESLEELHVFVLAHVLSRPIVITADTILKDCNGDALAPISFGGIYLPLQISPHLCHRSPLVLSYDSAHFSALVPMKNSYGSADGASVAYRGGDEGVDELPDAIPLVDSSLNLLPVHFLVDPDESVRSQEACLDNGLDESHETSEAPDADFLQYDAKCLSVISKYLDIQVIPIPSAPRELSHSFSHLSLKLKSGSCNDIARVAMQSRSSTLKPFAANENKDKEKSSSIRSEASRNEIDGAEEEASSNHVRAPSSLTSSPMAKGRMKLPQVAQNVVKTFNSLGRTVKKKIRQSSSSSPFKKVPSVEKKTLPESGKRAFKMSESLFRCGSLKRNGEGSKSSAFSEKSNRESGRTDAMLDSGEDKGAVVVERNSVLCARLTHTKQLYQDQMMSNYLESACQRFELLKQNKSASNCYGSLLEPTTDCVNEGCDGLGTQKTSYLCRDCFERHMKEEMEHERTNMAAKILNRKSTAASASSSAPVAATTGKGTGISSSSINSSGSSFAGKTNLDNASLARRRGPDGIDDDDDGDGGNSNNNNNNADEDFNVRLQYFTAMPSVRAPPLPAGTSSSSSSPLRPSTSSYTTNKPPFVSSHQLPPSSSSPRGRKPLPNMLTPTISYFSNFNASSSALGRVESGPKLPTLPAEPGRRSLVGSPRRARIGISPGANRSAVAESSSPLVSRFASSSPVAIRSSPGGLSSRCFSRSNCEGGEVESVWSSRVGSSTQQCNLQQQQPSFQHSHRQQEQQQQNLQHSQRQLQQSLLYLQHQSMQGGTESPVPSRGRTGSRTIWSSTSAPCPERRAVWRTTPLVTVVTRPETREPRTPLEAMEISDCRGRAP